MNVCEIQSSIQCKWFQLCNSQPALSINASYLKLRQSTSMLLRPEWRSLICNNVPLHGSCVDSTHQQLRPLFNQTFNQKSICHEWAFCHIFPHMTWFNWMDKNLNISIMAKKKQIPPTFSFLWNNSQAVPKVTFANIILCDHEPKV